MSNLLEVVSNATASHSGIMANYGVEFVDLVPRSSPLWALRHGTQADIKTVIKDSIKKES